MRLARVAAACIAAALAFGTGAPFAGQALYKWTDVDGKTQYSDKPPKNFKGEVVRIDTDEQPATLAPYKAPSSAAKSTDKPAAKDVASERRELRQRLADAVTAARAKLAAAQTALDDSSAPQDDERQIVQQRVEKNRAAPGPDSLSTGGMLGSGGMLGGAPRSNCTTTKNADGRTVTTCPTGVPNDAYYDRIRKLEEDVRTAEEELAAAERAYRRGAD